MLPQKILVLLSGLSLAVCAPVASTNNVAARALLSPKSINLDPVRRAVDGMDADKAIVHSQRKRSDDTVEAPDLDSALGNYQGSNGKRSTNEDDVPEDLDVLAGNYQG